MKFKEHTLARGYCD